MLVSPSKLKLDKIAKNRTLNFETVKRTHQNLVVIAGTKKEDIVSVMASQLFRPQQLMASFIPRIIKPMNRKPLRLNQKDFYASIRELTNNRLKIGKVNLNIYNNLNLLYNIIPEFTETEKLAEKIKPKGIALQKYMMGYFEELIFSVIEGVNYSSNYLVFPLTEFIEDLKGRTIAKPDLNAPIILFLKGLRNGTLDLTKFQKFDKILFYNPNAKALFPLDLKEYDPEKDFLKLFMRINRLNNFNNNEDKLDSGEEIDSEEPIDDLEAVENMKENIKELVFNKVAKTIKASNLTDFEASSKDEQDLVLTIDKKIDSYLENPENVKKPFSELVSQINSDKEITVKAIKYVETKKVAEQKINQLTKNLEKETEIINSIEDLNIEDEFIEPDVFDVKDVDDDVRKSKLSSLDEEYNNKQAKKDLTNVISSFSGSYYVPMTVDALDIEDTSDTFNQIETVSVKYKTDEGKSISLKLDIPKIVDKRYFYLGGNKKIMIKQLVRLPIVKTKPDRVEITTNYNKITLERTTGNLSRKNAYLLKTLKDYKDNPAVTIVFGSNSIINNSYKNDFEYEELADEITSISTPKYDLIFNRKTLEEELSMMNLPENFITSSITPLAINKVLNGCVFIEEEKVFEIFSNEDDSFEIKQLSESLFDFIYIEVLKRTDIQKLPKIGKSFVYTKMKIFGETYPIFAVVGFMNGITDILKRYDIKYKLSNTKIVNDAKFVEVKFKDKYLYYEDNIKNTLLLNVLYTMGTEEYDFSDFDLDKPYSDFFVDKLDQPVFIKNTLRINLNVIIDPITKEVLKDLKLPTDVIDLLLLANTMLTTNTYRPQNDIRNFRIRGNEIVYAMVYQVLADAYAKYQRAKINGKSVEVLDIPRNILISRLMQEPNVNDHSTLNPVNF